MDSVFSEKELTLNELISNARIERSGTKIYEEF